MNNDYTIHPLVRKLQVQLLTMKKTNTLRVACAAALVSLFSALSVPAGAATQTTTAPPQDTVTATATTATTVTTAPAEPSASTPATDPAPTTDKSTPSYANVALPPIANPEGAPSFLNDPTCVPDPEHPTPVVYLHGTTRNMRDFYGSAEALHNAGYCVWGYNYGKNTGVSIQSLAPSMYATGDIFTSVDEVARDIDYVLSKTGADKVDLVGHSQGGMIPKAYIAKYGASKVDRVVSMGAPFHGTEFNGMGRFARALINFAPHIMTFFLSPASAQQIIGSDFNTWLNNHPDTVAGVTYTSFFTPDDTVVTPNSTSHLTAVEGADVANVNVKEVCPFLGDKIIHDDLPTSTTMASLTYWALNREAGDTTPTADACTLLPNEELSWY